MNDESNNTSEAAEPLVSRALRTFAESLDDMYRAVVEHHMRELDRLREQMEREDKTSRILYAGLSRRTRMKHYDRLHPR